MLIKHAQLVDASDPGRVRTRIADVRTLDLQVAAIGDLTPMAGEKVIDAAGNALLPGLHDHHVHFLSYAASLSSVPCGPPSVTTEAGLAEALATAPGDGWLRGYGYHESVAGDIDRQWLDRYGPDRPVRVQHRSGRLWIVNSAAFAALDDSTLIKSHPDGRLFEADEMLRKQITPDLSMTGDASRRLAAWGVTAINDMTPSNDLDTFALFHRLMNEGVVRQSVRMSGRLSLNHVHEQPGLTLGETKFHLHEAELPDFDTLRHAIAQSHDSDRRVAVHCVTETELVFALAALREAGTLAGDRIEHASVTPPALIGQIHDLKLTVVTQPGFIENRGDAYLRDIPEAEHPWLYRIASFRDKGIALAFSTDMPFGHANPWRAMHAATSRRTAGGDTIGPDECVSPEFAVAAFLGATNAPTRPRFIEQGGPADLCLLDRNWQTALSDLSAVRVRLTINHGSLIHDITDKE